MISAPGTPGDTLVVTFSARSKTSGHYHNHAWLDTDAIPGWAVSLEEIDVTA